jgi:flagellar protein FlbD
VTLINGGKIVGREPCEEVTERVLAYRARLLSAVAQRLPSYDDLQRVVSIASLDVSCQSAAAQLTRGSFESGR